MTSVNVVMTMNFAVASVLTKATVTAPYAIALFVCAKRKHQEIGREVLTIERNPHDNQDRRSRVA